MTPLAVLTWTLDHAAYAIGAWVGLAALVGLATARAIRPRHREPEVWGCGICGRIDDTASASAQHLLDAHPEACPWDAELGSVAP